MKRLRFKVGDLVEPSPEMSLGARERFGLYPKRIEAVKGVTTQWPYVIEGCDDQFADRELQLSTRPLKSSSTETSQLSR